jgi:hypothetical protein
MPNIQIHAHDNKLQTMKDQESSNEMTLTTHELTNDYQDGTNQRPWVGRVVVDAYGMPRATTMKLEHFFLYMITVNQLLQLIGMMLHILL